MMTCITRVKAAEVCKEVDDDSGIEFGEVDLRICIEAILLARCASVSFHTNWQSRVEEGGVECLCP